jgi:hypothetical protein
MGDGHHATRLRRSFGGPGEQEVGVVTLIATFADCGGIAGFLAGAGVFLNEGVDEGIPPQEGANDVLQQHGHGVVTAQVLGFVPDEPAPLPGREFFKGGGLEQRSPEKTSQRRKACRSPSNNAAFRRSNRTLLDGSESISTWVQDHANATPSAARGCFGSTNAAASRRDEPRKPAKALHHVIHIPSRCWNRSHHDGEVTGATVTRQSASKVSRSGVQTGTGCCGGKRSRIEMSKGL